MLKFLIDGDMIVFEACSSIEKAIEWEPDLWTLHADANEAKAQVDERIAVIVNKLLTKLGYEGQYEIILCFSDHENFRKKILSTYKANREGKRKPVCYKAVVDWCLENYKTVIMPTLEADDVVGILATSNLGEEVHISGDKDYKSIPGVYFDHLHNELYHISPREADKWFYMQCLIGDISDNYTGCPGIGAKTAEKIFAKEGVSWNTVLRQFVRKGYGEEYALQQARVARILRKGDLDADGKPLLWTPK